MSPALTLVNVSSGPAVHVPAGGTAAELRAEAASTAVTCAASNTGEGR